MECSASTLLLEPGLRLALNEKQDLPKTSVSTFQMNTPHERGQGMGPCADSVILGSNHSGFITEESQTVSTLLGCGYLFLNQPLAKFRALLLLLLSPLQHHLAVWHCQRIPFMTQRERVGGWGQGRKGWQKTDASQAAARHSETETRGHATSVLFFFCP